MVEFDINTFYVNVPHEWLSLVSHESYRNLTGLPKEALDAHGPHSMHHVSSQTKGNNLWHVKCLPLVEKERKAQANLKATTTTC